MICQYRFNNYNKCTTSVSDANNGKVYAHTEAVVTWEISIPSSQFFCEPKMSLSNTVFKKNKLFELLLQPFVKCMVSHPDGPLDQQ